MDKRRVVITGLGAVTPFGVGVDKFWESLKAGKSGISTSESIDIDKHVVKISGEVKDFHPEEYMDAKEAKKMDRFIQFAMVAADEAVKDSKLDIEKEDPYRVGVIVSSAAGGFRTFEENHMRIIQKGPNKCSPFTVPMMIVNMPSGRISMKYGFKGINKVVVSACATGSHSIGDAFRAIQYGDADVMVAGGAEATICDVGVGAFSAARTLSKRNDEPQRASRPYDKDRDGFVMSEGAGVLILEEYEHAKKRGAHIYAEVAGYGQTADAYDIVAPAPDGSGAIHSMEFALKDAGMKPSEVQYINTHGTSTGLGDKAESHAVAKVFGDRKVNPDLYVTSTKSMHGHMLGATGAAEAIACVKAINENIVPPTINLDNQDEEVADLNYVPYKAVKAELHAALSNSFGFGGQNASLVFKEV
ncbi:MAG: beta-ketoacyl-ACP synthase II [Candidatus Gastranaerophilaceae bacterium]|jgi:3-oxoacyl-[acyl-carrier-protein] synthase II|nr:beta-ketoacyl-[acyl-carrier-protein] synthase II [bacterium]MEE0496246.1 beta-ketoacyl-ACP synthase II [Cyanobacteriota bacterium]CDE91789.1 3-oxoacyl-[acyl-carrier-protein] synthase 2 [Fusobacterium sp. CAG:815]DAA89464.1 MAG TPA: beta-ketoacyl-[acyl-carrier-protein] synthase II [Candidatus Gastranaerophilales bacterium HUM_6]DAA92029.1 MAG TPA: beta-ketoacyl-[acyl-carrier-protein] synthase II [Candidatus Gastranaerophilales bacterium HUM_7]DAB04332.1 MAG TPA: beta-ketoacyl-[acyl-carrier-p